MSAIAETNEVDAQGAGQLEFRTSTQIGVSYPNRTVELIVMPYEEEALIPHGGRMVTEIVSRGAFSGVQRRISGRSRVVANRDHDPTRIAGKAIGLYPSRNEGLVAEIRMSPTLLGDETLALADDGIIDASAGFRLLADERTGRVRHGSEVWESRDRRRLNHLYLDHIAFTPTPAYTGAQILAIRQEADVEPQSERDGTPNIDFVRGWRLTERYARLS